MSYDNNLSILDGSLYDKIFILAHCTKGYQCLLRVVSTRSSRKKSYPSNTGNLLKHQHIPYPARGDILLDLIFIDFDLIFIDFADMENQKLC